MVSISDFVMKVIYLQCSSVYPSNLSKSPVNQSHLSRHHDAGPQRDVTEDRTQCHMFSGARDGVAGLLLHHDGVVRTPRQSSFFTWATRFLYFDTQTSTVCKTWLQSQSLLHEPLATCLQSHLPILRSPVQPNDFQVVHCRVLNENGDVKEDRR